MSIQSITLHNFRSYKEESFEFSEGVNIVIGPNAAGKTNLLEAVYASCLGGGFRSNSDSNLILNDQTWARIDSIIDKQERSVIFEKKLTESRLVKRYIFGGNEKKRMDFNEAKPLVLFQPDDLRFVAGSPARRRDYIDGLLIQLKPTYKRDLSAYNRALLQRNNYLKRPNSNDSEQMFVWNMQLAERGGIINHERQKILNMLSNKISDVYSRVAGSMHKLSISYDNFADPSSYSNALLKALDNSLNIDRARGYTSVGVHRDNISIEIDNQPFKDVASRGENRTLILALKIIELDELEESRGIPPLLLLDDVFSELDGSRRSLLTKYLSNNQTLITTTDADVAQKDFSRNVRLISI